MSKKIKIIIAVLVVIGVCAGVFAKYSKDSNVEQVTSVVAAVENDSKSISIKWDSVKNCTGYNLYESTNGAEFRKIATVDGEDTTSYVFGNAKAAEKYDFYVTAVRKSFGKSFESKRFAAVRICIPPEQSKIKSVLSQKSGVIAVEWSGDSNADGYQIQYAEGDNGDMSTAKTQSVADNSKTSCEIDGLKDGDAYSIRMRAYIKDGNSVYSGAWSDIQTVKVFKAVKLGSDIDTKKPMIALTFDDGPGYNSASDDILDVLEKYNARATFFMVGQNAKDHPKNLKRKVELGCELGNHTFDHTHYGKKVTKSDIKKASDAIYDACGQYPTAFRSPGGNTTQTIRDECEAENMPLYYWSLDTQDWKYRNADHVYNAVMKNVKDGDIILMHEIYSTTADAVKKMVPELIKQGYQLVTCEELIQAKTGEAPSSGVQYVNAKTINNKTK